jgi:HD-GYP domain-containing protein (c-di-GMP phosphodiesterase class II)
MARSVPPAPTRKKSSAKKGAANAPARSLSKGGGGSSNQEVAALITRIQKLESLLDVAKAMTGERDLDALLKLILGEAVEVVDADRCTLWIVDRERSQLWTKVAQGLESDQKIRIPIGVGIAGQVAATGEIINIPDAYADPRFNRQVDKDTGYHTRNILGVPMRSQTGEVTGVLQALNKQGNDAFTRDDEELLVALGQNAAAAIENAILYEEIDRLFEGFVKASVVAIESRDPTTSGHSERVALLTLGIAEGIERVGTGAYAGLSFRLEEMREIRYAALLHDFGKVGVRESVLVKAEKLYPGELDIIETRFRALFSQKENAYLRGLIEALRKGGELPSDYEAALKGELGQLEEFLAFVKKCNQPTVLATGGFEKLREIANVTYNDVRGQTSPLLTDKELTKLSIPRGSLDPFERLEIESHVTHTFRFLSQIPWTRNLRRVPEIAYAHHEKLDGFGYPRQLQADQIPVQSRMMTVADIYDALTASDRPYKKAVPHEKAIDILSEEVKTGKVDRGLLDVFIGAEVHKRVIGVP